MTIEYIVQENGLHIPRQSGIDRQFKERIAELEFALEDRDWLALGDSGASTELSRHGIQEITRLARIMYVKNPLIQRGVNVASDYIWGRDVNISAKQPELNEVVKAFLEDLHNQVEFTSQQSRIQKDRELRIDGNVFFVFFVHEVTGHIRVGSIPAYEIVDKITDPGNKNKTRYYKRQWAEQELNEETGSANTVNKTAYYPDWGYTPDRQKIGNTDIVKERVLHIKVGGFSDWKFGVSEVYAAIDWAKAYKVFLENWSTIVAAYARFAFKATTTGGKAGVAAAKARLATTVGSTTGVETNPPPTTAATFVRSRDSAGQPMADLEPIRTAGATTSADDARRLLLMVAAAFGLPESFFGDVQGTYATGKTLDRPTELAFVNRQALWANVLHQILDYVIYWAIAAVQGPLKMYGSVIVNEYGEEVIKYIEDFNPHVDIDFPAILEHELKEELEAVQIGSAFIPDRKLLARMVLVRLGENDIDELLDTMFPENGVIPENDLAVAVESLREAINTLAETLGQ